MSTHVPRSSPRPRALLIVVRDIGDSLYFNGKPMVQHYLDLIVSSGVVDSDLSGRAAVITSALGAHRDLDVIAGSPHHNLVTAMLDSRAGLSRHDRQVLGKLRKKANAAKHVWPADQPDIVADTRKRHMEDQASAEMPEVERKLDL